METVTLKMERRQIALLKERAKALGCSQAAVVRNLIDKHLTPKKRPSLHDLAKDLCGSLSGPTDMSTRKLTGYGRKINKHRRRGIFVEYEGNQTELR